MASLADRIARAFPGIGSIEPLREVGYGARSNVVAPLLHFGEPFAGLAISAYQEAGGRYDREIAFRVDRYWRTRALGGAAFSIEHESEAEVLDPDSQGTGDLLRPLTRLPAVDDPRPLWQSYLST